MSARFTAPISDRAATANVTRLFRAATPEHREAGTTWYADAQTIAFALAEAYRPEGVGYLQVCGVLAAVSPLNSWGANVNLAARIVREHAENNHTVTTGYLGTGLRKAAAILAGENIETVLNSPKITNFYACIAGAGMDSEAVCIDRHAWDIAVNTRHRDGAGEGDVRLPVRPSITGARYAWAAGAYVRAAAILSAETGTRISPAQVQAVTWLTWRRRFWAAGAFDQHTLSGS